MSLFISCAKYSGLGKTKTKQNQKQTTTTKTLKHKNNKTDTDSSEFGLQLTPDGSITRYFNNFLFVCLGVNQKPWLDTAHSRQLFLNHSVFREYIKYMAAKNKADVRNYNDFSKFTEHIATPSCQC